ncbi:MAG: type II toxin-antitoxin system RelB/DinJ family antitoxin [Zoogloeaceae bacterium]|jgi:DNA-damage-inducible protein J|nr:type II toxin-antitoxin system RelB/DinJ family antitoxin [Zoogloeaceae bacterium]
MATALVQVDEALKREADAVLADLGLTVPDLVQTLLTRIAREKAVPFEVKRDKPGEEELARRRKAVEFARVNCELEGLSSDEESNQMEDRYARGEISAEALDAYVDKRMQDFINAKA